MYKYKSLTLTQPLRMSANLISKLNLLRINTLSIYFSPQVMSYFSYLIYLSFVLKKNSTNNLQTLMWHKRHYSSIYQT